MARSPCTFRQRDAAALVRAVRQGGCDVARVEVTPEGKIVVVTAGEVTPPVAPEATPDDADGTGWEDV